MKGVTLETMKFMPRESLACCKCSFPCAFVKISYFISHQLTERKPTYAGRNTTMEYTHNRQNSDQMFTKVCNIKKKNSQLQTTSALVAKATEKFY